MMKRAILFAVAVCALSLAGCGEKTEEAYQSDAAPAAAATTADETAAGEEPETGAMTVEAADAEAAMACVKDAPSDAICTMDINACGFSSVCNCGDGYTYDAALGKCTLALEGVSQATQVAVDETDCAKPATGRCTRDINACGHASSCSCDEGFVWNDVAGMCLRDLTAAVEE